MIFDKQNLLSDDQAVTTSAAAENVIDLGGDSSLVQDANEKGMAELLFQVTDTFTGGTSIKVDICNESDATISDATGSVAASAVIATATLVAGYQFRVRIPKTLVERYLGAYYTVVGTMTAGKITAGFVMDQQTNT